MNQQQNYKIGLDSSPYCKCTPKNFIKRLNKDSAYICDDCNTGHFIECDESNYYNTEELKDQYLLGNDILCAPCHSKRRIAQNKPRTIVEALQSESKSELNEW